MKFSFCAVVLYSICSASLCSARVGESTSSTTPTGSTNPTDSTNPTTFTNPTDSTSAVPLLSRAKRVQLLEACAAGSLPGVTRATASRPVDLSAERDAGGWTCAHHAAFRCRTPLLKRLAEGKTGTRLVAVRTVTRVSESKQLLSTGDSLGDCSGHSIGGPIDSSGGSSGGSSGDSRHSSGGSSGRDCNGDGSWGSGLTPLHVAVAGECEDAVRVLVAAGARVDAVTDAGETPVAFAVGLEHAGILSILLESISSEISGGSSESSGSSGSSGNVTSTTSTGTTTTQVLAMRDARGRSAYDLAKSIGNTDILQLLPPDSNANSTDANSSSGGSSSSEIQQEL